MENMFDPLKGTGRETLDGYTEREAKQAAALISKVLAAVPEDKTSKTEGAFREKLQTFAAAAHLY